MKKITFVAACSVLVTLVCCSPKHSQTGIGTVKNEHEIDTTVDQMMQGLEGHLDPKQLQQMRSLLRQQIAGYAEQGAAYQANEDQPTVVDTKVLKKITADEHPELPSMPKDRERLDFSRTYSKIEFSRMSYGLDAASMDEKWIMILQNLTLRMWRSWPPHSCIFELTFENSGDAYRTVDVWLARDFAKDPKMGKDYSIKLLDYLIQRMLLAHFVAFPFPESIQKPMDRMMFRHGLVGSSLANGEAPGN